MVSVGTCSDTLMNYDKLLWNYTQIKVATEEDSAGQVHLAVHYGVSVFTSYTAVSHTSCQSRGML